MNDLSLGEFAQEAGISRLGVYDIIKRCSAKLRDYEKKLGLRTRFESIKADAEQIRELTEQIRTASDEQERGALADRIVTVTAGLIEKL